MRRASANRLTPGRRPGGFVLVAALVCLFVVMLIAATAARSALVQHRQRLRQERALQAAWLAESAAERAAVRLRADPGYSGETWRPAFPSANGPGEEASESAGAAGDPSGVAEIAVETSPAGGRRVRIVAHYPDGDAWAAAARKEMTLP